MRPSPEVSLIIGLTCLALAALTPSSVMSREKGHQGKSPNFYSLDKEKTLGKQLAQEVERSSRVIDNPGGTDYVNRIAQTIAKNSDAKFPITICVIDSDKIDALTLPGGYQYINRGLILATESEAELAGVLAHGIAHAALRSETTLATKNELIQLASIPAMIYLPYTWSGKNGAGNAIWTANSLAIPLTFLMLRRDEERVADFFAVQYLYKAGYGAESYPRFLERIWPQTSKGQNVPKVFSPFPPLPERLKTIRKEIVRLLPPRTDETVSSPEFAAMKERLRAWQPKEPPAPDSEKPTLRKPADHL